VDEFNCWEVIPLVSKSAGLSDDGKYLHEIEIDQISLTRLLTNGLSFFLLVIQERTIWLSDQKQTFATMLIDLEIKLYILVPSTAAINSNLGKECCLRGAALYFDISMADCVPCCRYATAP